MVRPSSFALAAALIGCGSGAGGSGSSSSITDAAAPPPPADADPAPAPPQPPPGATPLMAELMGRIQIDELRTLAQTLEQMSQPNRATGSENYRAVTEWARQLLTSESPALQVRFDERGELRNVEITLPGSDPGAGVYILGGHLDSVRRTAGMDDNGSGSLGTALVARALGHYRFRAELRFLLFDAEEVGLVGSGFYAKNLLAGGCAPGTCLKFYLNMDMIGHDPDNRNRVQLFTAVPAIFDLFSQTEQAQKVGITVNRSSTDACNSSDDCSFARQGYDTGFVFEARYFPMRHTPADTTAVINFETMTTILKLVAASLATAAGPEGAR